MSSVQSRLLILARLLTYALLVCFLRISRTCFFVAGMFLIWDLAFFLVSMIDLRIRSARRRRMCSCPHLKDFKKTDGLKVFRKVHAHFVCCGSREARKRKVQHRFLDFVDRGTPASLRLYAHIFVFFSIQGELVLLSRMWNVFKPSPLLPFVRLFWVLHRKPAYSPSRAIYWSFSGYGN